MKKFENNQESFAGYDAGAEETALFSPFVFAKQSANALNWSAENLPSGTSTEEILDAIDEIYPKLKEEMDDDNDVAYGAYTLKAYLIQDPAHIPTQITHYFRRGMGALGKEGQYIARETEQKAMHDKAVFPKDSHSIIEGAQEGAVESEDESLVMADRLTKIHRQIALLQQKVAEHFGQKQ